MRKKSACLSAFADKPTIIYGLVDPRTKELRYVGKTITALEHRLYNHIGDARRGRKQRVSRWIRGILLDGFEPTTVLLDIIPPGRDWAVGERSWIRFFRDFGLNLVNQTDGGEGCSGFQHSAEFCASVSIRNSKPEIVAKFRGGLLKHRAKNPDWVDDIRQANKKTWANAELKAAHSVRMKRAARETRYGEKVSAKKKVYWSDPDRRATQSKTIAALCQDPDHIAKISAGATNWMAERRAIFDRCVALVSSNPDLARPPLPTEPTHHSIAFWRETEARLLAMLGSHQETIAA